ncbi:molecular chaperone DnaJ [Geomesophilobacter sediminis]|uniref:Molecular chaperone DnaJ n=1 Tax=Geomesophilobacter sediminis TaxID=2798584 RepID=A0A8J7LXV6_9BACT|nr:molecular chaperone DnaJ [Geomesophilobacter sediminis]MBJ6723766.1 molecular chaperone DnaJ [Geomesophilobacter sediminis]
MRISPDHRLPEELELENKLNELVSLRERNAQVREQRRQLQEEIRRFEKVYQRTIGKRIAELEQLEAEIARYTGVSEMEFEREESVSASSDRPGDKADAGADLARAEEQDIKALYREVAKAIHPDLAQDEDRAERHELMSKANQAYAEDDHITLKAILRDWQASADQVQGDDIASELIRVIRLIARERDELRVVHAEIDELRNSYICRLKLRVDTDLAKGSDLFADLCAAADLNIARAKRRLSLLKGEREVQVTRRTQAQTRTLCFPLETPCGVLYTRDRTSISFNQWKRVGQARGPVEVGVNEAVRLDVKEHASARLPLLRDMDPDALQAIFLYEVSDADVTEIVHLTGLEELYLSGSRLTDGALSDLAPLTNLKRLYLYQTQVTDQGLLHLQRLSGLQGLTCSGNQVTGEGLAFIERSMPGMKTVNIPVTRFSR